MILGAGPAGDPILLLKRGPGAVVRVHGRGRGRKEDKRFISEIL